MNIIKFFFKEWHKWKVLNKIDFWEAYEWHKNAFTVNDAQVWRAWSLFGMGHCTPHFATSARMFGLTPEEAIERYKKWFAGILAKPMAVHLDYRGVMRATTEEPTGLATVDTIPIFDADLKED